MKINKKEINFKNKCEDHLLKKNFDKKFTQKEILMDYLMSNTNNWFYIWELMGQHRLGWLSHKVDVPLSELSRENKIQIKYIGKYAVYSII